MYVDKVLAVGEEVRHYGVLSLWSLFGRIFLGFLLLPFFGVGIYFLVTALITYKSTELVVTNRRIIAKFGFIRRHTYEMNLDKIESFQVEQSVLARLLNFGTIIVRGTGSSIEPVIGIANPLDFRKAVVTASDATKSGIL